MFAVITCVREVAVTFGIANDNFLVIHRSTVYDNVGDRVLWNVKRSFYVYFKRLETTTTVAVIATLVARQPTRHPWPR